MLGSGKPKHWYMEVPKFQFLWYKGCVTFFVFIYNIYACHSIAITLFLSDLDTEPESCFCKYVKLLNFFAAKHRITTFFMLSKSVFEIVALGAAKMIILWYQWPMVRSCTFSTIFGNTAQLRIKIDSNHPLIFCKAETGGGLIAGRLESWQFLPNKAAIWDKCFSFTHHAS